MWQLLRRIQDRIDLIRNNVNSTENRNQVYRDQDVGVMLDDFENAVRQMQQQVARRYSTNSDARLVLDRATALDNVMRQRRFDAQTLRYWSNVRTDLNELANIYGLAWNRGGYDYPNRDYPNRPYPPYGATRLTGTYQLNSSRSEDPAVAIDRALRSLPYQQRQQRREQLLRRLDSPAQIALDVNGRNVTMASTRAPAITFEADGAERVETLPNGRTIRVRTSLSGNQLMITTTGDRDNQFTATFVPDNYGRGLRVTRGIYADTLATPIEIQSFYDKSSDIAQLNIYSGPQYPTNDQGYPRNDDDFWVRNGETLVAELDTQLSTRDSREGDRFTAIVRSPSEYAGAIIEGHVTGINRSGRISGRSEMTLNFDRIRLGNGRSYRFAGYVQTVRMPDGDIARVDNEGAIREENQSSKTIQRTAIGTAIGALIGAIAGGGKGAAIGAAVGAGAGAGSVYVQGRDDLDLPRGTEITIQATGPNRG